MVYNTKVQNVVIVEQTAFLISHQISFRFFSEINSALNFCMRQNWSKTLKNLIFYMALIKNEKWFIYSNFLLCLKKQFVLLNKILVCYYYCFRPLSHSNSSSNFFNFLKQQMYYCTWKYFWTTSCYFFFIGL
jgi:hypothetical protein